MEFLKCIAFILKTMKQFGYRVVESEEEPTIQRDAVVRVTGKS